MNKQAGAALGQTQLKRDKALLQLPLSGKGSRHRIYCTKKCVKKHELNDVPGLKSYDKLGLSW